MAVATLSKAERITRETQLPEGDEMLFGDYDYGRWMWHLEDIQRIDQPVPARGRQWFWNWPEARIN